MIIRNPYRVTNKLRHDEKVHVSGDKFISSQEWCEREAERLMESGIAARAIHNRHAENYVVRKREGCRFDTDEETNESFEVEG